MFLELKRRLSSWLFLQYEMIDTVFLAWYNVCKEMYFCLMQQQKIKKSGEVRRTLQTERSLYGNA